jgi:hypothetical protein
MAKKKDTKEKAQPKQTPVKAPAKQPATGPAKQGRKKVELSLEEQIAKIFELEKKLAAGNLDPKERFNTMWKRNKLKRDLKRAGHEIPERFDDLVQPKLSGWFIANPTLSVVDLLIYKIAYSKGFEKKIKDNVKRLRTFKKMRVG